VRCHSQRPRISRSRSVAGHGQPVEGPHATQHVAQCPLSARRIESADDLERARNQVNQLPLRRRQFGCSGARSPGWGWAGGMYWLTVNTAPWGSVSAAILAYGTPKGGTVTVPPNCVVRSAIASVSWTENVTLQCGSASPGKRSPL
jgi:dienelactone hydrolase